MAIEGTCNATLLGLLGLRLLFVVMIQSPHPYVLSTYPSKGLQRAPPSKDSKDLLKQALEALGLLRLLRCAGAATPWGSRSAWTQPGRASFGICQVKTASAVGMPPNKPATGEKIAALV